MKTVVTLAPFVLPARIPHMLSEPGGFLLYLSEAAVSLTPCNNIIQRETYVLIRSKFSAMNHEPFWCPVNKVWTSRLRGLPWRSRKPGCALPSVLTGPEPLASAGAQEENLLALYSLSP